MVQSNPVLSIIAPAYNEEKTVAEFYRRTSEVLNATGLTYEFVFTNDGSTDGTLDVLLDMQAKDQRVVVVDLSRNFGKEIALTAGLDFAQGSAAIPMDVDLQDPPEVIPELIQKWQEGFPVVNARRRSRDTDTWLKRFTASLFYKLMKRLDPRVTIPENVGDFRLIDRKVIEAVISMREHHRFMKGIFAVAGFKQAFIDYDREVRFAGTSKFNYWRLWNFSLEGITSFTTAPLRLFTYIGILIAFLSFGYGAYILIKALLWGDPVAGFPSLFVGITFLGGLQLTGLGIIGEYLGRVFNETKRRPLYFLNAVHSDRKENIPQSWTPKDQIAD